jgi:hypothetical protein
MGGAENRRWQKRKESFSFEFRFQAAGAKAPVSFLLAYAAGLKPCPTRNNRNVVRWILKQGLHGWSGKPQMAEA